MQGHRRLSGAGPALHDEHTPVRGADDAVLLGLDGPHDVRHAAGAGGVHGGQQHGVAVGVLVAGTERGRGLVQIQDLVVQGGDAAFARGQVSAAAEPHGGVARRQVERSGHRGAPVDEQRGARLVLVADAEPADVVVRAVAEVDPAETEPVLHGVQRGEAVRLLGDGDVPLQPGLTAVHGLPQRTPHGALRPFPQGVETLVEQGDEFLLANHFLA